MTTNDGESIKGGGSLLRRWWPLAVLVAVVGAFVAFGPDNETIFRTLRDNREMLLVFVDENAVAAVLIYIVVYVVVIAFSLPGGAMMTLAGGFLFGPLRTTIYVGARRRGRG
jgi:uncharacterized membrane protein YdjX (TVP38/TMEM64 family)